MEQEQVESQMQDWLDNTDVSQHSGTNLTFTGLLGKLEEGEKLLAEHPMVDAVSTVENRDNDGGYPWMELYARSDSDEEQDSKNLINEVVDQLFHIGAHLRERQGALYKTDRNGANIEQLIHDLWGDQQDMIDGMQKAIDWLKEHNHDPHTGEPTRPLR